MKSLAVILLLSLFFTSCNIHKGENDATSNHHAEWYGNWVGAFIAEEYKSESDYVYSNKINIRIIDITKEGLVTGQSIVAGNKRSLKGNYDEATGKFVLKEPGTNKYDGIFEFVIKSDTLKGIWTANNTALNVTKRSFELVRKQFVYNKLLMLPSSFDDGEDYIDYSKGKDTTIQVKDEDTTYTYIEKAYRAASEAVYTMNASTTALTEADLKNLKKLDLEIIRNTIYARHGCTFSKKSVCQFFDRVEWYVPISDNVESKLTTLEVKNIALLKRFEKYAEDNYDTFGR